MDQIISSFKAKRKLNSKIWENTDGEIEQTKLNGEIRSKLIEIATTFIESLKLPDLEIEDILFLGSLAGYNWSQYSDIDLHILVDKSKLDGSDAIMDEYFHTKKEYFNEKHDIKVKGFEVELYVQDINDSNVTNGMYSVLYNKWEKTPDPEQHDVDRKAIVKKVKGFVSSLKTIKGMVDSEKKVAKIDALKDKIRKYRQEGLNDDGEYSTPNLVFKYLRRSGFMDELSEMKRETTDKILSLKESFQSLNENAVQMGLDQADLNEILKGYLVAALWTEEERLQDDGMDSVLGYDEDGTDRDERQDSLENLLGVRSMDSYTIHDLEVDSKIQAYVDIKKFMQLAGQEAVMEAINEKGLEQLGHDIWLTRNRHGAGFGDHGYEYGDILRKAAQALKEVDLYVTDNGTLSFSNAH